MIYEDHFDFHSNNQAIHGFAYSDHFTSIWGDDRFYGRRGHDHFYSFESTGHLSFHGGRGFDEADIYLAPRDRVVSITMYGDVQIYTTKFGASFFLNSVEDVDFHFKAKP